MNTKKPKLKKYRVNVCRIAYGNLDIEVEARNARAAERLAEADAGNHSFTEHTAEYRTQTCQRLEPIKGALT